MKRFFLIFLQLGYTLLLFGQNQQLNTPGQPGKPPIDDSAINAWPSLNKQCAISRKGTYFLYTIQNQPTGHSTLVVQAIHNSWEKEVIDAEGGFFCEEKDEFIYKKKDTLYFWPLGKDVPDKILPSVQTYKRLTTDEGDWVAIGSKSSPGLLTLLDLRSDSTRAFSHVQDYFFSDKGPVLVIRIDTKRDDRDVQSLWWMDCTKGEPATIWSDSVVRGEKIVPTLFGFGRNKLAFSLEKEDSGRTNHSIWYYQPGLPKAVMRVDDLDKRIPAGYSIDTKATDSRPEFSTTDQYILFRLKKGPPPEPSSDAVKVDLWSYRDSVLQSTQLAQMKEYRYGYVAIAIQAAGDSLIRICSADDYLDCCTPIRDQFVVWNDRESVRLSQYWWNLSPNAAYYLLSLKDTFKVTLDANIMSSFSFSPGNNYLVYFNTKAHAYFSYNLRTRQNLNISKGIPVKLTNDHREVHVQPGYDYPIGVAGWLINDEGVFVYDNYDIWQLDPSGKTSPVNITNGYGRLHRIVFRFIYEDDALKKGLDPKASILLSAFDMKNKYDGFYRTNLRKACVPELLYMGPFTFSLNRSQVHVSLNAGMKPLKAADSDLYVVMRQADQEAPNYFWTTDFRTFHALSNLHPQTSYNWLSSQLISWKQFDGTSSQGVLYKPANFDPHRKYPILFYYYELMSHQMYLFPEPGLTGGFINIPWFVSRGYLVFEPDIHYTEGRNGWSTVNAVASAAMYLAKFPFVDRTRMGINGHSFGGFETNYLITHTHLFAAAVSSSGTSDFISSYATLNSEYYKATSRMDLEEAGQGRMGVSLWQRPDLYIQNSPIFNLDKVTTPVLIMHNKNDEAVPWMQGVELFTSLRRLGKKAWMLQYDEGGHGVHSHRDANDFTIRVTQFFDYYLRGALPPKWMTLGIPADQKGIITGYELDGSGRKP